MTRSLRLPLHASLTLTLSPLIFVSNRIASEPDLRRLIFHFISSDCSLAKKIESLEAARALDRGDNRFRSGTDRRAMWPTSGWVGEWGGGVENEGGKEGPGGIGRLRFHVVV